MHGDMTSVGPSSTFFLLLKPLDDMSIYKTLHDQSAAPWRHGPVGVNRVISSFCITSYYCELNRQTFGISMDVDDGWTWREMTRMRKMRYSG
jgi:hypothetical protein